MRTKQEVINFLESKVGTTVPCPGRPDLDGQCITLIKSLLEFLGAPDPYKARGHAKTVISAYLNEGVADHGTGFLSVFSNISMGGGYGHIWCNAGDGAGTYYESNGAKPLIVTKGKTYSRDFTCNLDKYIKEEDMSDDAARLSRDHYWNVLKEISEILGTTISQESDVDKLPAMVQKEIDRAGDYKRQLEECQKNSGKIDIKSEVEAAGSTWEINGLRVDSNGLVTANYSIK